MKPRELEGIVKADGWKYKDTKGSHKHYKHPSKPGKVTIPFHENKDLKIKTVNSILKQAGLK
ncbi:type II toxin-antitoxin system HicA family toxin [Desulfosporosinus sp. PR]|uniref:type II toxin-antitoxin system HicA family toxin n=1 Tax=Candidatus Desulfosporosinus nitrosoreducens TaxID=3401928 RepID=UPI0027FEE532|nr:type II toxin-antitoxin system HicA family toxin [Desulfosporosinus sp. PR]MDQ7095959.1 type II toxin-antitoxin system HicA family toxin [Desulfosporosinus sp. PR]